MEIGKNDFVVVLAPSLDAAQKAFPLASMIADEGFADQVVFVQYCQSDVARGLLAVIESMRECPIARAKFEVPTREVLEPVNFRGFNRFINQIPEELIGSLFSQATHIYVVTGAGPGPALAVLDPASELTFSEQLKRRVGEVVAIQYEITSL